MDALRCELLKIKVLLFLAETNINFLHDDDGNVIKTMSLHRLKEAQDLLAKLLEQ